MSENKYRILIVDDHLMMRESITQILNAEPDFAVVAQVASVSEALAALEKTSPELAIVDLSLGKESGFDLISEMLSRYPQLKIVVLSMHDEVLFGEKVLKIGARGYVSKDESPVALISALRKILAGGLAIGDRLQNRLVERLNPAASGKKNSDIENLTNRELEILRFTAQGLDKNQISVQLGISANTVETHRTKLKVKLGVANYRDLFLRSLEAFPEFAPPSIVKKS